MSESFWQTVVTSLVAGLAPVVAIVATARVSRKQFSAQDVKLVDIKHAVNGSTATMIANHAEEMKRLHDKLDALEAKLARTQDKLTDANKG